MSKNVSFKRGKFEYLLTEGQGENKDWYVGFYKDNEGNTKDARIKAEIIEKYLNNPEEKSFLYQDIKFVDDAPPNYIYNNPANPGQQRDTNPLAWGGKRKSRRNKNNKSKKSKKVKTNRRR
jgi:hypothetical protein